MERWRGGGEEGGRAELREGGGAEGGRAELKEGGRRGGREGGAEGGTADPQGCQAQG